MTVPGWRRKRKDISEIQRRLYLPLYEDGLISKDKKMQKIEPFLLKLRIDALFQEYPELKEDEDLRLLAIESETDCFELLKILVDDINSAKMMQHAIKARITDMEGRLGRYEKREEAWCKLAQQLMEAASLRKAELPEATLSIRSGVQGVRIVDSSFIPEAYWRVKREPNISLIKDALKNGSEVPGAALSNAPETLSIRTR